MNAERIWVRVHGDTFKGAVCGIYLRVNGALDSTNLIKNRELLDRVNLEIEQLRSMGYKIALMGDFNARVPKTKNFPFENYPHDANNNGSILQTFAESSNVYCLNPMRWDGIEEERFTYQRRFGRIRHASIIDYVLADEEFISITLDMKVKDCVEFSVSSDHSTLFLKYSKMNGKRDVHKLQVNILRHIKAWGSYKAVLEGKMKTVRENFDLLSIQDQCNVISEVLTTAGKCVLPTTSGIYMKKTKKTGLVNKHVKHLLIQARRARKSWRQAVIDGEEEQVIMGKEESWQQKLAKAKRKEAKLDWKRKLKLRRQMADKGAESSRLFWKFVSTKTKGKISIDALETDQGLSFDPSEKASEIEKFFKEKFKASETIANDLSSASISDDSLGKPEIRLSSATSRKVMRPITAKELGATLDKLDVTKAEGEDGLTNAMLRNTGKVAREVILDFLNNVMAGGVNPDQWKVGKVVLVLKRQPSTYAKNYRPITLISVLSKVLSSILAVRVSEAVEESGICGDTQNGFRKHRGCADNLLILNTMLELTKKRSKHANLLFLDFAEAYDRVDRKILFQKLRQLNFPESFVRYLEEYYANDFIVTDSAGKRTKKLYLCRGLRQGCPMSAILFAIYISELGWRLEKSRKGIAFEDTDNTIVSNLFFADDGVLMANSSEDLDDLKSITEGFCHDFGMKISSGMWSGKE